MSPAKSVLQRALFAPDLDAPDRAVKTENVLISLVDVPKHIQERALDTEKVTTIAESIRTNRKLYQPITVQRRAENFELVFGRHRLEACRILELETIPAQVWDDLTDAEKAAARLAENLARRQMPPFEEAQMMQELRDLGHTVEKVAEAAGVSVGTVKNRLKLIRLPPEVASLVDEDKVKLQDAQLIASLKDHEKAFQVGLKHLAKKEGVNTYRLGNELEAAGVAWDPDDWKISQKVGYHNQAFLKAAAQLPHIKIGSGKNAELLVTDKKQLDELVKEHVAKRKSANATKTRKPAASPAQKRAQLERDLVPQLELEAAEKSIRAMVAPNGAREMGELVQYALSYRVERKSDWKWLEKATEVDLESLKKIIDAFPGPDVDELEKLAKRDELAVWKILAGVTVLRHCQRYGQVGLPGEICKAYTGRTPAQWEALAKAKAKAAVDAEKKTTPKKKATKKTTKKAMKKKPAKKAKKTRRRSK